MNELAVREAEERIAAEKTRIDRTEREKRIADEAAEHAARRATEQAEYKAAAKELSEKHIRAEAEAKEQRRIANKKHRSQIEGNIHGVLMGAYIGLDANGATAVLNALKENRIPHVTINY